MRYKGKHYGRYKTLEEAKEAYKRAKSGVEFVPATRKLRHLPKGVSRLKTSKNYLAKAQIGGVRYYLGTFRTIEEASEAYNNIIKEKTQ